MDLIDLAQKASGLSTAAIFALALITGGLGLWGFTKQHDREIAVKDELIKVVGQDRDFWRAQAQKAAEINEKWADHSESITSLLESSLQVRLPREPAAPGDRP